MNTPKHYCPRHGDHRAEGCTMCNMATSNNVADTPKDRIHQLKTWPEYYAAIVAGLKPFEIRRNDRGYQVGDVLLLRNYDPKLGTYSGESCYRIVTYVTDWEQKPGNVVMGIGQI